MPKKAGSHDPKIKGPLYTSPGKSLGACETGGPQGGKSIADPLGFIHGGRNPNGGKK